MARTFNMSEVKVMKLRCQDKDCGEYFKHFYRRLRGTIPKYCYLCKIKNDNRKARLKINREKSK